METDRSNRGQARYDAPGIGGSCCKGEGGEEAMSAPVNVSKPMLTLLIILGLIGIGSLGYTIGAHNVSVVTMTQPSQVVMETQTVYSISTETQTSISQVSVVQAVTQAIPLQIAPLPNTQTQFCNYSSFSGDWCAGGMGDSPAQTVSGYLVQDEGCTLLHGDTQDYALYNVPSNVPTGGVEVYGYVFYNWPSGSSFPMNAPFTDGQVCGGVPVWMLPPYFQQI